MSNETKKPVILAVDDEPVILNSVLSVLKSDYSVVPFTSGELALKYLENKNVDLILLDLQMPGMTGFEVLEKILKNGDTYSIPVIFLTGAIDADGEATALQMGASDYILKPIRPSALLTRVSVQLELQNHRKKLEYLVREKTNHLNIALEKIKKREETTFSLLARVTDLRDSETGMHIERTTLYVKILVNHLLENPKEGYILDESHALDIIKSAKLHDLGKIAIPDNILLKEGKLTDEEFTVIMTHPVQGEKLIMELIDDDEEDDKFLLTAKDIAKHHHEKWSGHGYPDKLKGDEIPLPARIVAIADVYDALTSVRPYKNPFSHEKSVEIITLDSGIHFDPYLVDLFLLHQNEFKAISQDSAYQFHTIETK